MLHTHVPVLWWVQCALKTRRLVFNACCGWQHSQHAVPGKTKSVKSLHMSKWVDCFNNTHYRPEWIKVMKEIELSMGYVLMTGTSGTHIELTHWSPEHLLSSSLLFAWLKKTRKKKPQKKLTLHLSLCGMSRVANVFKPLAKCDLLGEPRRSFPN